MHTLTVKQVRQRLSQVVGEAERGGETIITRYGKPVARIVPIEQDRPTFPDLTKFRKSHKVKPGEPTLTDTLLDMRREERF
jgi:prevent-host-death family protein